MAGTYCVKALALLGLDRVAEAQAARDRAIALDPRGWLLPRVDAVLARKFSGVATHSHVAPLVHSSSVRDR